MITIGGDEEREKFVGEQHQETVSLTTDNTHVRSCVEFVLHNAVGRQESLRK